MPDVNVALTVSSDTNVALTMSDDTNIALSMESYVDTSNFIPYTNSDSNISFGTGQFIYYNTTGLTEIGYASGIVDPEYSFRIKGYNAFNQGTNGMRIGSSNQYSIRMTSISDGTVPHSSIYGPKDSTGYLSFHLGVSDEERLRFNKDGSLQVQTANYEDLVTDDDDIPNKKYVDDKLYLEFLSKSSSYELAEADNGKVIAFSDDATVTLPDGLSTGFNCVIENVGSSKTITLNATTTLNTKDSAVTITDQYGAVSVVHKGSNVWHAWGDLA